MKNTDNRDEVMVRYLLGQLPEEDQLRLEEQFFTDDESYEQLLALEDELKYDYATGELAGSERERFKERFLVTPEDRKKLAFASALITTVAPQPEAVVASEVTSTPSKDNSWWRSLATFLNLQNPVVRYSFAAAALIVVLGTVWLIAERFRTGAPQEMAERESQSQQQESAQRNGQTNDAPASGQDQPTPSPEQVVEQRQKKPSIPDDNSVRSIATLLLTPGLTRDGGEMRELVVGKASHVHLTLSLRRNTGHPSYRAVLRTLEGAEVWSQSGLSARRAGARQAVVVQLRSTLLAGGDYELILQGAGPAGNYEDVDEYYFRIVKK